MWGEVERGEGAGMGGPVPTVSVPKRHGCSYAQPAPDAAPPRELFRRGAFTESAPADGQPPALSGAPPSSVRLDGEDTATGGAKEAKHFLRERTLLARTASRMDARDRSSRAGPKRFDKMRTNGPCVVLICTAWCAAVCPSEVFVLFRMNFWPFRNFLLMKNSMNVHNHMGMSPIEVWSMRHLCFISCTLLTLDGTAALHHYPLPTQPTHTHTGQAWHLPRRYEGWLVVARATQSHPVSGLQWLTLHMLCSQRLCYMSTVPVHNC